jgi:hypothetical protein
MLEVVSVPGVQCVLPQQGTRFRRLFTAEDTMLSHTVRFCSRLLEVGLFFAAAGALAAGAVTAL